MHAEHPAHSHRAHSHGAHGHGARSRPDAAFSLLRLSATQRLGIALLAVAALWGGVYWALS